MLLEYFSIEYKYVLIVPLHKCYSICHATTVNTTPLYLNFFIPRAYLVNISIPVYITIFIHCKIVDPCETDMKIIYLKLVGK